MAFVSVKAGELWNTNIYNIIYNITMVLYCIINHKLTVFLYTGYKYFMEDTYACIIVCSALNMFYMIKRHLSLLL